MTKVLITAQVRDTAAWEKKFRTHREHFRSAGVHGSMAYGIGENNQVAVIEELDNPDDFMKLLNSPENIRAMDEDGVKRETVRYIVLDKELVLDAATAA